MAGDRELFWDIRRREFLRRDQAMRVWENGRFVLARASLAGLIAGWIGYDALQSHSMDNLLERMRKLRLTTGSTTDVTDLLPIQAEMKIDPVEFTVGDAEEEPAGIVPVEPFMREDPPASPAVIPTPTPVGATYEWIHSRRSTIANAVAINSQVVPSLPTVEPLPDATPITTFKERNHWEFRGQDRRLLETLWECIEAVENRDLIASEGRPSAAISTRSLMLNPDDADIQEAWAAVKDQLSFLLGQFRE